MEISKHVRNAKVEMDKKTRKDYISRKKINSLKGLLSEVMIKIYKVKEYAISLSRKIFKKIDNLFGLMRDFID